MGIIMLYNLRKSIVLSFVFLVLFVSVRADSLFDIFSISPVSKIMETNKDIGFLVDNLEFRKRQLENMNKSQDELMKEIEETQRYLTQTSKELHIELSQLNKKYAKSSLKRDELEVIGKKSELLNDRIQQSSNHQELIREYEMSTDNRLNV